MAVSVKGQRTMLQRANTHPRDASVSVRQNERVSACEQLMDGPESRILTTIQY
jgi:hypothetical protein